MIFDEAFLWFFDDLQRSRYCCDRNVGIDLQTSYPKRVVVFLK